MSKYVSIFLDIAFVFQDLKVLKEEAELLDNTLEYDNDTGNSVAHIINIILLLLLLLLLSLLFS